MVLGPQFPHGLSRDPKSHELPRQPIAERGVATTSDEDDLDVIDPIGARGVMRRVVSAVYQCVFQAVEETLRRRVVPAIALAIRRAGYSRLNQFVLVYRRGRRISGRSSSNPSDGAAINGSARRKIRDLLLSLESGYGVDWGWVTIRSARAHASRPVAHWVAWSARGSQRIARSASRGVAVAPARLRARASGVSQSPKAPRRKLNR